jgi:integrase/recombinase XerC
MSDLFDNWIQSLQDEGKSSNTIRVYETGVKHLLNHFPGAPSTINTRLAAARAFLSWLLGDDSPAKDVSNVEIPKKPPQALSEQDQRSFLRAVHSHGSLRDIAIVEVLLGTGLRSEELLSLQLDDINIRERSGEIIVREGKNSKYREVPLPLATRRALSAFLSEIHPRPDNPGAYLWTGQRGPLQDTSTIFRMLAKYAYLARIEPFGPHVLRHTYATRYLEKNPGDIRGLAELLGHEDINTTMRYTQPNLKDLQKRVENL